MSFMRMICLLFCSRLNTFYKILIDSLDWTTKVAFVFFT